MLLGSGLGLMLLQYVPRHLFLFSRRADPLEPGVGVPPGAFATKLFVQTLNRMSRQCQMQTRRRVQMPVLTEATGDFEVEWEVDINGDYQCSVAQDRKLALAQERMWAAVQSVNWEWDKDRAWNDERRSARMVEIAEDRNRVREYIKGSGALVTSTPPDGGEQVPASRAAGGWRNKRGWVAPEKTIAKRRLLLHRPRIVVC